MLADSDEFDSSIRATLTARALSFLNYGLNWPVIGSSFLRPIHRIRERKQGDDVGGVLGQPLEAHLHEIELALIDLAWNRRCQLVSFQQASEI